MTRASLLHILDHVSTISDAEVRELEQLATAFPYCQTAHLLLAKAAHDKGSMLAGQRLRRAATHAADRQLLRQLMEQQVPAVASVAADAHPSTPTEVVALLPAPEEPLLLTASVEEPVAKITAPSVEIAPQQPAEPLTVASERPASEVVAIVTATPQGVTTETKAETLPADQEQKESEQSPTPDTAIVPETVVTALTEELLPAVAPPIRTPAEAGTSRFEFGLGETLATDLAVYALPVDAPAVTAKSPPFYADPEVGYTIGYGSRLGSCLQAQGELTNDLPDTVFFPADALLLEHVVAHQPAVSTPSSLAIIEQFLRKKPRLRTPAVVPPADNEQTDLSVPSTSAAPTLASESLAKIMVRQGKTAKAIEIYERLMVRQPEKKAYFAAQIDQLKQSE